MTLELAQPPAEMSTRNLLGGKERQARKAGNNPNLRTGCLENMGASTSHNRMDLHGRLKGEIYLVYKLN
jgi:hypothetical protein